LPQHPPHRHLAEAGEPSRCYLRSQGRYKVVWQYAGSEGGEIMTIIQVAMLGKLTYADMTGAIFRPPLLAEGLNALFATLDAN
jgi:hypothetical protein